jgi:hypothetical protein
MALLEATKSDTSIQPLVVKLRRMAMSLAQYWYVLQSVPLQRISRQQPIEADRSPELVFTVIKSSGSRPWIFPSFKSPGSRRWIPSPIFHAIHKHQAKISRFLIWRIFFMLFVWF